MAASAPQLLSRTITGGTIYLDLTAASMYGIKTAGHTRYTVCLPSGVSLQNFFDQIRPQSAKWDDVSNVISFVDEGGIVAKVGGFNPFNAAGLGPLGNWNARIKAVASKSPWALKILQRATLLSNQSIARSLLIPKGLNEADFDREMQLLITSSLISEKNSDSYSMDPFLKKLILRSMEDGLVQQMNAVLLTTFSNLWPSDLDKESSRQIAKGLADQLYYFCMETLADDEDNKKNRALLLAELAVYFTADKMLTKRAVECAEVAVAIAVRHFKNTLDHVKCLRALGQAYNSDHQAENAVIAHETALKIVGLEKLRIERSLAIGYLDNAKKRHLALDMLLEVQKEMDRLMDCTDYPERTITTSAIGRAHSLMAAEDGHMK